MGDKLLLKNGSRLDLGTGTLLVRGASDPDPDSGGLIRLRSPKPTNEVNWDDPLNKGLVAWWTPSPKRRWRHVKDQVNGNDLYMRGNVTPALNVMTDNVNTECKGIAGWGLGFESSGTSTYAESIADVFDITRATLSFWVKGNASANKGLLAKYDVSPGHDYTFRTSTSGGGEATFIVYTDTQTNLDSNGVALDGTWHHVVGTYDGATMSIYIDGIFDNSTAKTGDIRTSGTPIGWGTYFPGQFVFGDSRVYSRALSESEVHDLYVASRTGYVDQFKRRSIPFGVTAAPAVGFNHWYARQARTHRIVGSGVHV